MTARQRYLALIVWSCVLVLWRRDVTGDWSYFVTATRMLRGDEGLGLYARHPDVQIGPLALYLALPLAPAPLLVAKTVTAALGVLTAWLAERLAVQVHAPVTPRHALGAGLLMLTLWSFVVSSGHLDDALAVTLTLLALLLARSDHTLLTGCAFGAAVASKPWAAGAAALLVLLPTTRKRVLAAGSTAAVVVGCWAPFLVQAPNSLRVLASFRLTVSQGSGLHLLLHQPLAPMPAWTRPLQVLVGVSLGVLLIRAGRWWAVPAAAFGARVLLDPYAYAYYGAPLAAAALLVDLVRPGRLPWASLVVFAALCYPSYLLVFLLDKDILVTYPPALQHALDVLRLTGCVCVVALALRRREPASAGAGAPAAR